ncbi:MAG TPA: hypothetical protein VGV87_23390 [Blastocatellia bacterium]|nr:hypothetical protein [Blastocatellia bacterium]
MAKRPAKGQGSKGKTRTKASASKRAKRAVESRTRPQAKATKAVASKPKAAAAPQTKRGTAATPPSTDIRRAYKSRLLAGYIGTHGADSIPSAKK